MTAPLELRLDMDEQEIEGLAEAALLDRHATELPRHVGHPADDFFFVWQADGSAFLSISMWQQMVPPFRHAVAVIGLMFEQGRVAGIASVDRRSFGA